MSSERLWYLVINATRARILRELPDAAQPPRAEIRLEAPRWALRDMLRDDPDRRASILPDQPATAAGPPDDPMRKDAIHFLQDVADYLEQEHAAQAFDGLVLILAPEIAGLWHARVRGPLRTAVRREFETNLVRLPATELAPAIRQLLAE